jgi:hypothetical protein
MRIRREAGLAASAPAVERRHPVNGHINEHRHEVQCRVAERDLDGECESGGHCCTPTSSANPSSMVSLSSRRYSRLVTSSARTYLTTCRLLAMKPAMVLEA